MVLRSIYIYIKQYKLCCKDMSKQSIIYFCLISRVDVSIEISVLTDHKAIFHSINLAASTDGQKNNNYQKCNKTLPADELFKTAAKSIRTEC